MPEENPNTFFMISLIIQQLYREILAVADENGGKLKNRCVFFCDEFGTLPKIESAEMMFSASRSRRLQIVPIIQSFAQLEKNYGKEGAEIIVDNTQDTIFGGFAPNSSSAETLSKALGSRTVMGGSVSRSKNDPSQSLQMIERPLLIHSIDPASEFYITIYGSIAQSESENISANVKWGKAQSAKQGNVPFQCKHFLGYTKNADGEIEIVPEEAEIIREIYERYLSGESLHGIKCYLEAKEIPTPAGCSV